MSKFLVQVYRHREKLLEVEAVDEDDAEDKAGEIAGDLDDSEFDFSELDDDIYVLERIDNGEEQQ